jgi:hypothetical protein
MIDALAKIDVRPILILKGTSCKLELSEEVAKSEDSRAKEERGGPEFQSGRASRENF